MSRVYKKKALIVGLGISGKAAAEFCLRQGYEVLVWEDSPQESYVECLLNQGVRLLKDLKTVPWEDVSECIVSPGVAPTHPVYTEAVLRGIEVLGEAAFALPYFQCPLVAVTGTNGKTTVTLLIEHVLNTIGKKAIALGNVGTALCQYLLLPPEERCDIGVVELSSYQLETLHLPVFEGGVVLNITPDHLNRYGSFREYAQAKCQLQSCLKADAPFFVHSTVFSEHRDLLEVKRLQLFDEETVARLIPLGYRVMGKHDKDNILAAWALCRLFGVKEEEFCAALNTFRLPPHRLAFVAEINGVRFYDDSKGTNIDAVIKAVEAMDAKIVLIAGGVDKGASYLAWQQPFQGKVKKVIAIGQAQEKIKEELSPFFQVECVLSLEDAVHVAYTEAMPGECVLLSPGCASFDMFRDFAHRGAEFQRIVQELR